MLFLTISFSSRYISISSSFFNLLSINCTALLCRESFFATNHESRFVLSFFIGGCIDEKMMHPPGYFFT